MEAPQQNENKLESIEGKENDSAKATMLTMSKKKKMETKRKWRRKRAKRQNKNAVKNLFTFLSRERGARKHKTFTEKYRHW